MADPGGDRPLPFSPTKNRVFGTECGKTIASCILFKVTPIGAHFTRFWISLWTSRMREAHDKRPRNCGHFRCERTLEKIVSVILSHVFQTSCFFILFSCVFLSIFATYSPKHARSDHKPGNFLSDETFSATSAVGMDSSDLHNKFTSHACLVIHLCAIPLASTVARNGIGLTEGTSPSAAGSAYRGCTRHRDVPVTSSPVK